MKHQHSFSDFQAELTRELDKKFKGVIQNGKIEAEAQRITNQLFKQRKARKKLPTIDCGLTIVGCNLGFEVGQIRTAQWLIRFTKDVFDVQKLVPGAVALGYANEFQLYAEQRGGLGYLIARSSLTNMIGWCPTVQGVPSENSIHFVALERARMLGYLGFLRGEVVDVKTNSSEYVNKPIVVPSLMSVDLAATVLNTSKEET